MPSRFSMHVKTVQNVIKKYGQSVVYNRVSITSSENAWESGESKGEDLSVKMIFLPPTSSGDTQFGKELLSYLSGTESSYSQVRGYMADAGFTPAKNDIVSRGGKQLTIKAIDTLAPDGTAILHVLEFN